MTGEAKQGHRYRYEDMDVLAMESGKVVTVRKIEPGADWLGRRFTVYAAWLEPLPMVYHGNEVPK